LYSKDVAVPKEFTFTGFSFNFMMIAGCSGGGHYCPSCMYLPQNMQVSTSLFLPLPQNK
jgi:hypothetical protein